MTTDTRPQTPCSTGLAGGRGSRGLMAEGPPSIWLLAALIALQLVAVFGFVAVFHLIEPLLSRGGHEPAWIAPVGWLIEVIVIGGIPAFVVAYARSRAGAPLALVDRRWLAARAAWIHIILVICVAMAIMESLAGILLAPLVLASAAVAYVVMRSALRLGTRSAPAA